MIQSVSSLRALSASSRPTVPKLEMFARGARAGWDVWGAEFPAPVCV